MSILTIVKTFSVMLFYAIIILLILWVMKTLATYIIDTLKVVGEGFQNTLHVILYIIGALIAVWISIFIWEKYGKNFSESDY